MDALMSFLATSYQPPEPQRAERLRQELEQQLAKRHAKETR
ncbi:MULTISPECIES: hypothetical protein [Corallococcus]|nr:MULTISPECIES: hypothetical protein [Corallococcus]